MFARLRRSAALALAVAAVGACTDSTGPEQEPEVESIRLTFSSGSVVTSVVTISSTGAVTGTVTLPAGGSRTVAAEFLNAQGQPDDHVTADQFQLAVTPATGVTFSRTAAFQGTLTAGGTPGTVAVQFGLLHIEENHVDFGPFTVNVSVSGGAN